MFSRSAAELQRTTPPLALAIATSRAHHQPARVSKYRARLACSSPCTAVVRITNPLDHVTHEVELKIHPGA